MRTTYRVLAYLIAIEVVIQAAAIAYAYFGEAAWIERGGVLDQAVVESDTIPFPEVVGFIVHGVNGTILIPLLALVLLVVSFFAAVPRGVTWSGILVSAVAAQVLLGVFGSDLPLLGMLHGLNALIVFVAAVQAARAAAGAGTRRAEPASERADLG